MMGKSNYVIHRMVEFHKLWVETSKEYSLRSSYNREVVWHAIVYVFSSTFYAVRLSGY